MGEGTGELRKDIEATRFRVGEEVEALSYKTDVGARLDDYVDEKKAAVGSAVAGAKDRLGSAVPSRSALSLRGREVRRMARSNPLGLVVGAAAVGFVAGLVTPSTRMEDEHLGETADRFKEAASDAGQDAPERGMDVAQSAFEAARDEGTQQGRELASDLRVRIQHETAGEQRHDVE